MYPICESFKCSETRLRVNLAINSFLDLNIRVVA